MFTGSITSDNFKHQTPELLLKKINSLKII